MTQPLAPSFELPPAYPLPGEVLDGKYQIEKLLGEGGMGAVAKATHMLRRAPVALKFMSPAVTRMPGAIERFINEGVAASQIDSDHVVKVFDVGQLKSGAPYLVMEFLEGVDLAELLAREGTPGLPIARAVHFTLQVLRGLQVAHTAGIVHRDMKPSNCFVITKDGEPDFVKLVDFGISKVQQPGGGHITKTNSALGTPLYMSPEQARSPRDVDLRSDLYSVGVILYELLTGRTPFHSDSGEFTEILFKIFTQEPPAVKSLRGDLPDALCDVIHRALARDPKDRYATAVAMGDALAPWADTRSEHVLQRLRLAGGRSGAPVAPVAPGTTPLAAPVGQSVIPPAMPRNTGAEALAKTQGDTGEALGTIPDVSIPAAPLVPRAAASNVPRTDVGVAREVAPSVAQKRSPLVYVGAAAIVAALVGGGALVMRGAAAPASSGELSRDPTTTITPVASAAPLPPAPSASASASASSTASATAAPSVKAPASASAARPIAPPKTATPRDLGDLNVKQ